MELQSYYSLDVTSIFSSKIPDKYPRLISTDNVDESLLRKLKKFSYPFFTIAIVELGEDSDSFEILEGAFFIKLCMNSLAKRMVVEYAEKPIYGFHIYALNLSATSNPSFQPFMNDWIKDRFSTIVDNQSKKDLNLLVNSINVSIPEERLNRDMHIRSLNALVKRISDQTIINCFQKQMDNIQDL